MTLEDRIYCLQHTTLPDELHALLVDADIAYLQNRDYQSERLISYIEKECINKGIYIYKPLFAHVE